MTDRCTEPVGISRPAHPRLLAPALAMLPRIPGRFLPTIADFDDYYFPCDRHRIRLSDPALPAGVDGRCRYRQHLRRQSRHAAVRRGATGAVSGGLPDRFAG